MTPSSRFVVVVALFAVAAQGGTLRYGPVAPGWRVALGSSESPRGAAPGAGQVALAPGPVLNFAFGQLDVFAARGAGGVVTDVSFEQVPGLNSVAAAQRYLAGPEADEIPGLAESFKVTQTRLGSLRVFRNLRGAAYGNHAWLVEVDAARQLFLVCTSRIRVPELSSTGAAQKPGPIAAAWAAKVEQVLGTLRVEQLDTTAPMVAVSAPPPPSVAVASPPPPAPRPTTPPPPTPSGALVGRVTVVTAGKLPAVTVFNTGSTAWKACTVTVPGRRTFRLKSLLPTFSREIPLKYFAASAQAPEVHGAVLVQCAEGRGQFPARL